ncbi:hypothetical protein SFGR64A_20265 (plasmid) [Sinorhizobium fredii GR64]|nr:hypothetical protein [Sinorhizobium fredii]WOS66056.1 hypothetical protein SFGR64A_20265 [Sinorhizobium fredii GR64]
MCSHNLPPAINPPHIQRPAMALPGSRPGACDARLIARFRLEPGAAPRLAAADSMPAASPARALGRKLAGAFGGRSAAAADWQEF